MRVYILDTNFILRYLVADNKASYEKTKVVFEEIRCGKCHAKIEQCVFTEVIFVLSSFYKVPREEIVKVLKDLLSYKGMQTEVEVYSTALDIYLKHNLHIVDSIIATKALAIGAKLMTFDVKLQEVMKQ
jgi:predicted nucleic-acid-binding protein